MDERCLRTGSEDIKQNERSAGQCIYKCSMSESGAGEIGKVRMTHDEEIPAQRQFQKRRVGRGKERDEEEGERRRIYFGGRARERCAMSL